MTLDDYIYRFQRLYQLTVTLYHNLRNVISYIFNKILISMRCTGQLKVF